MSNRTVLINPESSLNMEDPEKQFRSFGDFITDGAMIKFGVALVISLQLKQIVENITASILTPIMDKILDSHLNKLHFQLFDINFQVGGVISNILSFLVIMFIIYYFIKIFKIDKKLEEDEKDKLNAQTRG
jgi:large conductance mechanosensitive channel protein